jgi:hypothetical protein
MNKFLVFPCSEQLRDKEDEYHGAVVSLVSADNSNLTLFFPIPHNYHDLINHILKEDVIETHEYQLISIYMAMLDSWRASERYLAGIILDIEYKKDIEEDNIFPSIILCDQNGNVDSVMPISFIHAVALGAIEKKEILVSDKLMEKLLPNDDEDDEDESLYENEEFDDKSLPLDQSILDIAKNIMYGKNKSTDTSEDDDENEDIGENKKDKE